jgi:hypothetical protein
LHFALCAELSIITSQDVIYAALAWANTPSFEETLRSANDQGTSLIIQFNAQPARLLTIQPGWFTFYKRLAFD